MAITLDGITLDENMFWRDRHISRQIAQRVDFTLGGRAAIFVQQNLQGRPITLESVDDQGWLTLSQVQAVEAISLVPGAVYSLVIEAETFNVIFRHQEPPAFQYTPLVPRLNEAATDYYTGRIRLFTV